MPEILDINMICMLTLTSVVWMVLLLFCDLLWDSCAKINDNDRRRVGSITIYKINN